MLYIQKTLSGCSYKSIANLSALFFLENITFSIVYNKNINYIQYVYQCLVEDQGSKNKRTAQNNIAEMF